MRPDGTYLWNPVVADDGFVAVADFFGGGHAELVNVES